MAKYRVLRNFTDKYTNKHYEKTKIYEFTDERAKEILEVGKLIELVEEITEEVKPSKKSRKKD